MKRLVLEWPSRGTDCPEPSRDACLMTVGPIGAMFVGMKRRLTTATLVAACLAATAPAAHADIRVFRATAEGSGTYERYDDSRPPGLPLGTEESVYSDFSWRVTIPRVGFDSGSGQAVLLGDPSDPRTRAGGTITGSAVSVFTGHGESGGQPVKTRGDCNAPRQAIDAPSASFFKPVIAPPAGEPGTYLVLRPFDSIRFAATCTGALVNRSTVEVYGSDPPEAFDHVFFLPKLATDQGKVIQHVQQTAGQRTMCPGRTPFTKECKLEWSGKITFDLVETIDTDPPVGDEPPPPGDEQPPGRSVIEGISRLYGASLSRKLDSASVTVLCAGGCRGTVAAYTARKRVASRAFAAAPAEPRRLTLRFRGKALKAVRRAKAVRLVVRAGDSRRAVVVRKAGRARR